MKGTKRWVVLPGLAVLLLTLLFSCSWTSGDDIAGTNIVLNIGDFAPRAIGVTYYDVTGLEIAVIDPSGEPLEEFEWDPGDGATQYLVPVEQAGQHTVVVTHIGEDSGEPFEATESSFFDIQPMIITVINIVPGMIGVIQVDGDDPGGEPSPCEQIIGTWGGDFPYVTGIVYAELVFEDGMVTVWLYDFPGGPLIPPPGGSVRGAYTCDGNGLVIQVTQGYDGIEWVDLPGMPPSPAEFGVVSDVLTLRADFDGDEILETTLTLEKVSPLCEQLIGTWTGMNPFPAAPGEMMELYVEMSFYADGTCEELVSEFEGAPPFDGPPTFRGDYDCDGTEVTILWTETTAGGVWVPYDPPEGGSAEINIAGDVLTFGVDFDRDGVPDAAWTLDRQ